MHLDDETMLEKQRHVIRTRGWSVTSILPDPGQHHPMYSYTAGLTARDLPELIITGLFPDVGWYLLDQLVPRVSNQPELLNHDATIDNLMEGINVRLVEAQPTDDIYPGITELLYPTTVIRLRQVVWPDQAGRFPGEPGYNIPTHFQPLLYKP